MFFDKLGRTDNVDSATTATTATTATEKNPPSKMKNSGIVYFCCEV